MSTPTDDAPPRSDTGVTVRLSGLLSTSSGRIATAVAIVVVAWLPFWLDSDFWMTVLANAGIFAIGGVGLSLLTGYAGQVSLGHAAFLSIGGYTAVWFSADQGWPLLPWLVVVALVGALVGAVVGPFALRFKGNYLVVVTLALLFLTVHLFDNWDSFTGGLNGKSASDIKLALGPIDFAELSVFGKDFTREQGIYYLSWLILGATLVIARNIVRTRPGRALQAVRDRDIAAEIVGVNTARYKVAIFALSSAIASVAGGLYAASIRFITPGDAASQLFLSIRFVAIIIVGGLGSLYGVVVGALFVGPLQDLVTEYADLFSFNVPVFDEPLVQETATSPGLFSAPVFSQILFGVLLILFLIFQPRGVAGMIGDARAALRRARSRERGAGGNGDN